MNFDISLTIDDGGKHKTGILHDLSIEMGNFLRERDYGQSIQSYVIGLTCVLVPTGYQTLFKQKKPVYVKDKVKSNRFTTEDIRLHKIFIDDIVLTPSEYEDFVSGTNSESLKIVAKRILNTMSNLDMLLKKVNDFDKDAFKQDMHYLLNRYV